MAPLVSIVWKWRQVKRAISVGVFGGGAFLLWLLYTGDLQGPVLLILGALLSGMGFVGLLFPSKVGVINTSSKPD